MANVRKGPGSAPIYKMKFEKSVYAPMRDGVRLACNIYRPDAEGRFPALLGMCPYSKEKQALKVPTRPFNPEYAGNEKGDSEYLVSRGYVHVVADIRGSGYSEGKFDLMSVQEQQDGYDLVEWIARQPWCDGNVGMIGISYLAIIQYLVAAQQPPHLKAIFPHDGWADMYRDISHHGGVLMHGWLLGFSQGNGIISWGAVPASESLMSPEELRRRIERLQANEVINKSNTLYLALEFPHWKPTMFDWLVNELDGPFYWERSAYTKWDRIKIPTFLGSEVHAYPTVMHLPGAFSAFSGIKAPKRLVIRPRVPERPFHEFHDEIVAWYDYWLKGIDTGVMDGPPIKIWVRGAEEWKTGREWPFPETEWTTYYLGTQGRLGRTPPKSDETPDGFRHKPLLPLMMGRMPLDPMPEFLSYTTEPFERDAVLVGPVALYLHASLSGEDGDFIVKLKDVSPDGTEFVLSRGWLKASHRELDPERSTPWKPYHPHTRAIPVAPGGVEEYAIDIRPIANLFRKGHRIKLEIWSCDYPSDPMDLTLSWPQWSHLSYDKDVEYRIHHGASHPSRLVLPVMPK